MPTGSLNDPICLYVWANKYKPGLISCHESRIGHTTTTLQIAYYTNTSAYMLNICLFKNTFTHIYRFTSVPVRGIPEQSLINLLYPHRITTCTAAFKSEQNEPPAKLTLAIICITSGRFVKKISISDTTFMSSIASCCLIFC